MEKKTPITKAMGHGHRKLVANNVGFTHTWANRWRKMAPEKIYGTPCIISTYFQLESGGDYKKQAELTLEFEHFKLLAVDTRCGIGLYGWYDSFAVNVKIQVDRGGDTSDNKTIKTHK